ncbi:hypothetical protein EI94DRAFT_1744123 [Lactarius quietus]|nr:hypothetical protein EI94DRAFT_1744123 [Lactarius quietus]
MKRRTSIITSMLHLASQSPHILAHVFMERVFAQNFYYRSTLEHGARILTQIGNKHAHPTTPLRHGKLIFARPTHWIS